MAGVLSERAQPCAAAQQVHANVLNNRDHRISNTHATVFRRSSSTNWRFEFCALRAVAALSLAPSLNKSVRKQERILHELSSSRLRGARLAHESWWCPKATRQDARLSSNGLPLQRQVSAGGCPLRSSCLHRVEAARRGRRRRRLQGEQLAQPASPYSRRRLQKESTCFAETKGGERPQLTAIPLTSLPRQQSGRLGLLLRPRLAVSGERAFCAIEPLRRPGERLRRCSSSADMCCRYPARLGSQLG